MGFGSHSHCFELHPFALEIDDVFGPQAAHDLHELIATGAAIFPAVATGFDFLLVPANTDAEIDPALGQPVERAHLLRGVDRVPLRHEGDSRAKPERAGHRRQEAEGRRDIQHPPTLGYRNVFLSNNATCSPIQIDSRPISSARRPKSLIMFGVASGDMKVENTPIFMWTSLRSTVP